MTRTTRWTKGGGTLILALLCVATAARADEPTLKVSGVPERLSLPLAEDANAVITVTVGGAPVRSAWLAAEQRSRARVMMNRSAEREFQINLAEPIVWAVLKASNAAGQFQVFAETEDGKVLSGLPIRYAAAGEARGHTGPSLLVLSDEPPLRRRVATPAEPFYLVPERVTAIQLEYDEGVREPEAWISIGGKRHALRASDRPGSLRLKLDADLREAWAAAGSLTITEGERTLAELKVVPAALKVDPDATVMVPQRGSQDLPGTNGYISAHIDDISGGHTTLTLRTADGRTLIGPRAAKAEDSMPFELNGRRYVLKVRRLINNLFDTDYAVLALDEAVDEPKRDHKGEAAKRD